MQKFINDLPNNIQSLTTARTYLFNKLSDELDEIILKLSPENKQTYPDL